MGKLSTVQECIFDVNIKLTSVVESLLSIIAKVDEFEEIVKLPLAQIPEHVRRNDPNLKHQAMYEIRSKTNTQYKILLGENTIGMTLNKSGDYTSWTHSFYPEVQKIFATIIESGKIQSIDRMGLRYIDFIEDDNIFQEGKISVHINHNDAHDKKMFLRVEGEDNGVSYVKNVSNNTQYTTFEKLGSVIDIVTAIDGKDLMVNDDFDMSVFFEEINSLHTVHTNKFKEVIRDEYIKQYEI